MSNIQEQTPSRSPENDHAGMMLARHEPLTRLYEVEPATARIVDGARTAAGSASRHAPVHGELIIGTSKPLRAPLSIHSAVGGDHDGPNPGDYLSAALAGCFDSTMRIIANRLGVVLEDLQVSARAEVDVRGTLMVDPNVPVGFDRMTIKVQAVPAAGTPDRMMRFLLEATERSCVVLQTLKTGVAIGLSSEAAPAVAPTPAAVESHYTTDGLLTRVDAALERADKTAGAITVDDLAPVDEFHIRGRQATEELTALAPPDPEARVLDVGSGIGGSARYLASRFGCHVTGVDLCREYCDVASALSGRVGLSNRTRFVAGSALDLPLDDDSFDLVLTEHAQMNIADKRRFYAEIARVLASGGAFAFHDIFAGSHGGTRFPVPWAQHAGLSSLGQPERVAELVQDLGLSIEHWEETTDRSLAWFEAMIARLDANGPPPVGLHLLMGPTARTKLENVGHNLAAGHVRTFQALLRKPGAT